MDLFNPFQNGPGGANTQNPVGVTKGGPGHSGDSWGNLFGQTAGNIPKNIGGDIHGAIAPSNVGTAFSYLLGYGGWGLGAGGKATGDYYNSLTPKMNPQAPGAAPTLGQANFTALQGELQQEKNMRSTWGMLTGSGGVLDTPTTNSQRLLGA